MDLSTLTPPMHTQLSAEGGGKQGLPTRQPALHHAARSCLLLPGPEERTPQLYPLGDAYQTHTLRGAVPSPWASVSPPAKWSLSKLSLEQHLTHAEFSGDIRARGCSHHCAHSSPLSPATPIAKSRFKDTPYLGHLCELLGGLPTPSAGDEKGPVSPLPNTGLGPRLPALCALGPPDRWRRLTFTTALQEALCSVTGEASQQPCGMDTLGFCACPRRGN